MADSETPPSSGSKYSYEELMAQTTVKSTPTMPPLPPPTLEDANQLLAWRAKTTVPHGPLELSKISFFQGGALFRVDENGLVKAVDRLAEGSERHVLNDAVKQASRGRVNVEFQKLTVGKVGESFRNRDPVQHWSTHGFEDRIGFEDAKQLGMERCLHKEDLKKWIEVAGSHVRLIFIASCNTELIGEACVEAGIEHVLT